ncbi:hypothetical protein BKA70DRAFT_42828 [Coprinopsis sp. MPI-PUGE-AT-0042]|nr:hypothetical protein BKA70DRAFT_42828 [Coprinopsis sp. MPI-PUGE-AT-0042]
MRKQNYSESNTGEYEWNSNNSISFDASCFDRAMGILKALGHDPKTITAQALDELDEIFECTTCTSFDKGRQMLDWKAMIDHSDGANHTYSKVDVETANEVRARMKEASISSRARNNASLICVHCRFVGSGSTMRSHLATEHSIVPATDADAVLSMDSAREARQLRYWNFEGASSF